MLDQDQNDGREFFRIAAEVQVFHGPDTAEARQAMAINRDMWDAQSRLEQAARAVMDMEGSLDNNMLTVMQWLDFKLDLVLHQLRLSQHPLHFPTTTTTANLSGSGLGLAKAQGLAEGDNILLAVELPDAPYRAIYAAARVIWTAEPAGPGEVAAAVRFSEISDVDRERIIRFTFRQQRRDLARRYEETES